MRLARATTIVASLLIAGLQLLTPTPAEAFDNPGPFALTNANGGDFQIGAAGSQTGAVQQNLAGVTALSCQVRLLYGSGGTAVDVYIQTSLDQGQSWGDIANVHFTTAGTAAWINLSGLNSVGTPTAPVNQALASNTTFNGPLGDRLQAVVDSAGTYSGTLVSIRCNAR